MKIPVRAKGNKYWKRQYLIRTKTKRKKMKVTTPWWLRNYTTYQEWKVWMKWKATIEKLDRKLRRKQNGKSRR